MINCQPTRRREFHNASSRRTKGNVRKCSTADSDHDACRSKERSLLTHAESGKADFFKPFLLQHSEHFGFVKQSTRGRISSTQIKSSAFPCNGRCTQKLVTEPMEMVQRHALVIDLERRHDEFVRLNAIA